MLQHFPQFCNSFLTPRPLAGQRAWVAGRGPGRPGVSGIRPALQTVRCTSRCMPTPLGHVTRAASPPQRTLLSRWHPPRAGSLRHARPSRRRYQPHMRITVTVCHGVPDCPGVMVLAKDVRRECWHASGRHPLVPAGDLASYLPETPSRTYWRRPLVPTGDSVRTSRRCPSYLWETHHDPTSRSYVYYGLVDLKKTVRETTHTRCVCGMTSAHPGGDTP